MGSPSKLGSVFVFAFCIVGRCTAAVDQAPLFPRHHYSQLLARISLTLYHAPHRTSKARKIDSNSTILVHEQSDLMIPCGAGKAETKGIEYDSERNQITRRKRDGAATNHATLAPMKRCGCDAARYLPARLCTARRQGRWRWPPFSVYTICESRGTQVRRGTDLDKPLQLFGDFPH